MRPSGITSQQIIHLFSSMSATCSGRALDDPANGNADQGKRKVLDDLPGDFFPFLPGFFLT